MNQRLNVSLPEETIRAMDRIAGRGNRSRLINAAVRSYVVKRGRGELRKLVAEGAKRHSERDLEIAEEWFPIEEEAWRRK